MHREMPLPQRLDKIGELLAKGVYLYLKKGEKDGSKEENKEDIRNDKAVSPDQQN
jgi:hypothetical protein